MAWAPALLLCSPTAQAAVTQPSSLSANVGDTIRITCTGSSRSSGCGWHQQKVPGSGPVTVIYDNRRPSGVPSRFSRSTSSSTNTLTISGVQAEDEAVYFCGGYDGSSAGQHGGDTLMPCVLYASLGPSMVSLGLWAQGPHPAAQAGLCSWDTD
uniref:Ig-like domain-containing protein n=1 Tax=Cyanoderma ruficeps TaxID=181631 RepID=A0A8C3NYZ2_9PASS